MTWELRNVSRNFQGQSTPATLPAGARQHQGLLMSVHTCRAHGKHYDAQNWVFLALAEQCCHFVPISELSSLCRFCTGFWSAPHDCTWVKHSADRVQLTQASVWHLPRCISAWLHTGTTISASEAARPTESFDGRCYPSFLMSSCKGAMSCKGIQNAFCGASKAL